MPRTMPKACAAALLMALAGCESLPPAQGCQWAEPPPLPAALMQEPQDLQPLLNELIQPSLPGSKVSEPKS